MTNIKVGICGLGKMGKLHKKIYDRFDNVVVASYFDPLTEYNDWDIFLESVIDLDAISICNPNIYHVDVALQILKKNPNIKLLIEKPISDNVESALKLIPYQDRISIGHVERFNGAVRKVKEMYLHEDLGEIYTISSYRFGFYDPPASNSDVSIDLAIHDIDCLQYIFGNYPHKHMSLKKKDKAIIADRFLILGEISNIPFYIESCWLSPVRKRFMLLLTSNGLYEIDYIKQSIQYYNIDKTAYIYVNYSEPLFQEIAYFLGFIQNKNQPGCTVQEAINNLEALS